MKFKFLNAATYDAPNEGVPGADDAVVVPPKPPESVLFPDDDPAKPGDDKPVLGADGKPVVDPAAKPDADAWKEFEPDAAKTEAENTAAKVEHDKTKPLEKPAEWKEYENDPKKSDAENAAAKVEHDKTSPANDPAVVPEDGKYTLAMPEGVEVDQELLDALGPKFAAKKMTRGEAQGLADEFIKVQTDRTAKANQAWVDTVTGWVDTSKADKDMGGDKWPVTTKAAQAAIKAYGSPELKEYLDATGGGNHPELIRFMSKVGMSIKDDEPPAGGLEGGGSPADPAHLLFPNDKPKG